MNPVQRPDDRIMSPNISPWARYADYLEGKVDAMILANEIRDAAELEIMNYVPPPIVVDHRQDLLDGTFNKLDLPTLAKGENK